MSLLLKLRGLIYGVIKGQNGSKLARLHLVHFEHRQNNKTEDYNQAHKKDLRWTSKKKKVRLKQADKKENKNHHKVSLPRFSPRLNVSICLFRLFVILVGGSATEGPWEKMDFEPVPPIGCSDLGTDILHSYTFYWRRPCYWMFPDSGLLKAH
jgi:hypothetical protein